MTSESQQQEIQELKALIKEIKEVLGESKK